MKTDIQVQQRYEAAISRLCTQLQEDYYVLAAVLYGSVARGEPWERSDIDMVIVLRDGQERDNRELILTEDDINVSADVVSRNVFKRELEGALQGSFMHSVRSQYRLLFSKDESIERWLREPVQVNAHDQAYQLLAEVSAIPYFIDKATKWLTIKEDVDYCFLWLMFAVNALAKVDVILNGIVPGREALDQALKTNPAFFQANFTGLLQGPKNAATVGAALEAVENYLVEQSGILFAPILEYLNEMGGPVPLSELNQHFKKKLPHVNMISVYDWLVRHNIIQRLSSPVRLARKSTIELEEPSYYYDTGDISEWER